MTLNLFRPQLLKKGDGSLHIQVSLGEFSAELPVPEKFTNPETPGFVEFYHEAVKTMTEGLKELHRNHMKGQRNGYKEKRANRARIKNSDGGTPTAPPDSSGV